MSHQGHHRDREYRPNRESGSSRRSQSAQRSSSHHGDAPAPTSHGHSARSSNQHRDPHHRPHDSNRLTKPDPRLSSHGSSRPGPPPYTPPPPKPQSYADAAMSTLGSWVDLGRNALVSFAPQATSQPVHSTRPHQRHRDDQPRVVTASAKTEVPVNRGRQSGNAPITVARVQRSASQPRGHHHYGGSGDGGGSGARYGYNGGGSGSGWDRTRSSGGGDGRDRHSPTTSRGGGGSSHDPNRTQRPSQTSQQPYRQSRSYQPHAPRPRTEADERARQQRQTIAEETLNAIKHGYYRIPDPTKQNGKRNVVIKDDIIHSVEGTLFYPEDAAILVKWQDRPSDVPQRPRKLSKAHHEPPGYSAISEVGLEKGRIDSPLARPSARTPTTSSGSAVNPQFATLSTIQGAIYLHDLYGSTSGNPSPSEAAIGILNFASAHKPGGGWLNGAHAQEESIARSSTLYASLDSAVASPFYKDHKRDDREGYYTHGMIWSPGVIIFKSDDHAQTRPPLRVDVVSSPAVNAGQVRRQADTKDKALVDDRIREVMFERMGRILKVFEIHGVKHLVLGSFGTGVFQNDVKTVARIWSELLNGRFRNSFEHVCFAIPDESTQKRFEEAYLSTSTTSHT